MSAVVKLAGALPGGDRVNGIDPTREDLVLDPTSTRVAVIWYDVAKITTDVDHGAKIPTLRIKRVEPLGDVEDVPETIRKQIQEITAARIGEELPFEDAEVEVEGE